MTRRLLLLLAALAGLCAIACQVFPTGVSLFACERDGSCAAGTQCCGDGFCHASCPTRACSPPCAAGQGCVNGRCTGDCVPGATCATNSGAPCFVGRVDCSSGSALCLDGQPALDGTTCDGGGVCARGQCVACVDGGTCATNPTACRNGTLSCAASPTCTDAPGNVSPGSSCGVDKVCSAAGQCLDCRASAPCTTNPTACRVGAVDCTSGSPECVDGATAPAGTSCGASLVCNGDGGCIACVEGSACETNPDPCRQGKLQCSGANPGCVDDALKAPGTSCGAGKVCSPAHQCIDCAADAGCMGNPTACLAGVTTCSGGVAGCSDSAAGRAAGTFCGADRVCDGSGQCVMCAANQPCATNPNPCRAGATSCTTGAVRCVDSATPAPSGAVCGGGFCDGDGGCASCDAGTACGSNPNACAAGKLAWDAGVAVCACVDDPARPRDSSPCDGGFCWGLSCVACAQNNACATNSGAPCRQGLTAWDAGACTCANGPAINDNLACTGGRCWQGACVPCAEGTSCDPMPNPCVNGQRQWSAGTCSCLQVAGNKPWPGTACVDSFMRTGQCISGACCIGCVNQFTVTCNTLGAQSAGQCGNGGAVCHYCGAYEPNCLCSGAGVCYSTTGYACFNP